MDYKSKQLLQRLFQAIKKDNTLNRCKELDYFLALWRGKFERIKTYPHIGPESIQTLNETENDQFFMYEFDLLGFTCSFDFNVRYIWELFKNHKDAFDKIFFVNKNDKLISNGIQCWHNHLPDEELKEVKSYKDLDNVFVVDMPLDTPVYVVVDGNHRICSQIHEKAQYIGAYLVNDSIAGLSLVDPFQSLLFFFLKDIQNLKKILASGSFVDLKLYLYVYSSDLLLETIIKRYG